MLNLPSWLNPSSNPKYKLEMLTKPGEKLTLVATLELINPVIERLNAQLEGDRRAQRILRAQRRDGRVVVLDLRQVYGYTLQKL